MAPSVVVVPLALAGDPVIHPESCEELSWILVNPVEGELGDVGKAMVTVVVVVPCLIVMTWVLYEVPEMLVVDAESVI